MPEMTFKGTLTVDPEMGVVLFHDERGKRVLHLEGIPRPIRKPDRISMRLGCFRGKLGGMDVSRILEMARGKKSVLEISKALNIDGRKVSGVVSMARRRGLLPRNSPKEWSPKGRYPRIISPQ